MREIKKNPVHVLEVSNEHASWSNWCGAIGQKQKKERGRARRVHAQARNVRCAGVGVQKS